MYIGLHNHTDQGSNLRGFLDSTNKVRPLIEYAKECGHNGIAFTEHDTIASHMEVENVITALRKEDPDKWNDFRIVLGNEIYLCDREQLLERKEYVFPHFILLAKDAIGHKQIREMSTRSWVANSFTYVNIRTPTYYEDLEEVVGSDPGHLIFCTACLGSQTDRMILQAVEDNPINPDLSGVKDFLKWLEGICGKGNLFLEMQPSEQEAQIIVNKTMLDLSKEMNLPYVISTDSHYRKKEDRKIHEAFLNSNEDSGKQRETGEFYATTYVMTEEEIHGYMDSSLGHEAVQKGIDNTQIIRDMVEEYSLQSPLRIPYYPESAEEPNKKLVEKYSKHIPHLKDFAESKTEADRHLVRELVNRFEKEPETFNDEEMYASLDGCLDSIEKSSKANGASWSAYLLMTKQLVDTAWDSGSLCAPARGSGTGFAMLYALSITQINPVEEARRGVKTYPWRFLNPKRVTPLDIDTDTEASAKPIIIRNLQRRYCGEDEYLGVRRVMKVQTLSTLKSKSAIQVAARGLNYPLEIAQFLSSFIEADRGQLRTLKQTFYGDEENQIPPNTEFANLMTNEYPDIWEVAQSVEGLVTGAGSHAGGVIISDADIVESGALMKTSSGDIITQWNLWDQELAGNVKWDLLNTDALQKIHEALNLLLEDGYIEWQGSLRETYEKYLGIYNINRDNPKIWEMLNEHKIFSFFQFEKQSGHQAIAIGKPDCLKDLTVLNSAMRLMAPYPGAETPLERFGRMKEHPEEWDKEMTDFGLTPHEQSVIKKYAINSLCANQEDFMSLVQDPEIGGGKIDLLWADKLRKAIARKNPKEFNALQDEFYNNMKELSLSPKLCHYAWDILVSMSKGYGF